MYIEKYQFTASLSTMELWTYDEVIFQNVNLIVGDTASGKTGFINTIFSLGHMIASNKFFAGYWKIDFSHLGTVYNYELKSDSNNKINTITLERLVQKSTEGGIILIERDKSSFIYKGDPLPRLSQIETGITLLKDEQDIKPVYEAFSSIMRRMFQGADLEDAKAIAVLTPDLLKMLEADHSLPTIFQKTLPLNIKLYVLNRYYPEIFSKIVKTFRGAFEYIKEVSVKTLSLDQIGMNLPGQVYSLVTKEKNVGKELNIMNFSSGMLKVLLLATDIFSLPKGSVYIIDEYENSLGLSAINAFPTILSELDGSSQFIITSHHPYIINKIPVSDWFVFNRTGSHVKIKYGAKLVEQYGASSQKAFVQLLNDPFYGEINK